MAAGDGKPRNEGDSFGFAVLEDVVVRSVGQVVAILDADDVDLAACGLQLLDGDFGQTDVADLALGLQLGESPPVDPRAARPDRCGAVAGGRGVRRGAGGATVRLPGGGIRAYR